MLAVTPVFEVLSCTMCALPFETLDCPVNVQLDGLSKPTSSYENSNGTYTIYGETDSVNLVAFGVSFVGSVTNISVKEVGQDWTVADDDANNYVEFNQQEGTVRLKFLNTSPVLPVRFPTALLNILVVKSIN